MMDKKRAIINIAIGMVFKVIVLLLSIISKSFVVKHLGDEANGLYSLYVSVLGFLTIANLGIGSVITYSMYKPIVNNDNDTISALFFLYRKFYLIVMIIIFLIGIAITPIIPKLAKGSTGDVNIYITYIVFLLSVLVTYTFAHKTSLINAYKDNYITTLITSISLIIEGVLQIIVMVITKSFLLFLLVRILSNIINGVITNIVFRNKYKVKINNNKTIGGEIKSELIRNAKASMISEIGANLTSTFDGVIISFFVGVISLGLYSNYIVIATGVASMLGILFSEVTSIFGHSYVKQNKEQFYNNFIKIYLINFVIGIIVYLGFISISDELVSIIFGSDRAGQQILVVIIGINYYSQFQRSSVGLFNNASGRFHENRYRTLIEGITNIFLSILLVNKMGVSGVMLGTVISRLLVTYTLEPIILFNNTFNKESKKFLFIHFGTVIIFTLLALIMSKLKFNNINSVYMKVFLNGLLSVVISCAFILILVIFSKKIRNLISNILKDILKIFKKENLKQ